MMSNLLLYSRANVEFKYGLNKNVVNYEGSLAPWLQCIDTSNHVRDVPYMKIQSCKQLCDVFRILLNLYDRVMEFEYHHKR